jgi:RNA-directed DNA polymerase
MKFNFLGYTFQPRMARSNEGKIFLGFSPAISKEAEKAIKAAIRKWKVQRYVQVDINKLFELYNPKLRGWMAYYGYFRSSALYGIFKMFQRILVKWAKRKYKRLKGSWELASKFIKGIADTLPQLFNHWKHGWYANS